MSKLFYLPNLYSHPVPQVLLFYLSGTLCIYTGVGRSGSWILGGNKGNMNKRKEGNMRRDGLLTMALILQFLDFASMFTLHSV